MAAGVPQVIMPISHDQPDNARRVKQLGLGVEIPARKFQAPRVVRALQRLLVDAEVGGACQRVAERIAEVRDPYAAACQVVETYAAAQTLAGSPATKR